MVYKDIKHDLEFYPHLRERKNKNRYIAVKLEKKYKTGITLETLIRIAVEASTLDRGWRYILQNNPRLRGKDYGDKSVLSQEKQIELGYSAGSDIDEFKEIIAGF